MSKLEEDGLEIDFTDALHALKFDQDDSGHPEFHDLQNMPRVDFIVELIDSIYFIELKDPDRPGAIDVGGTKFLKKVENGTLEASLIEKYIYSFLFRWGENKLNKSVHYVSLITFESGEIAPLTDRLEKHFCQLLKRSTRWTRIPLASCQIHNIETWTAVFPQWPVTRIT